MKNIVWMKPPDGGPPIEVEDDGGGINLTPWLVKGYSQCPPPAKNRKGIAAEEVTTHAIAG